MFSYIVVLLVRQRLDEIECYMGGGEEGRKRNMEEEEEGRKRNLEEEGKKRNKVEEERKQ